MARLPAGAVYGYVGVRMDETRTPYQGRIFTSMIELAWQRVEAKFARWRPGYYRVFVYSFIERPDEYQCALVVVEEGGDVIYRKMPMALGE